MSCSDSATGSLTTGSSNSSTEFDGTITGSGSLTKTGTADQNANKIDFTAH